MPIINHYVNDPRFNQKNKTSLNYLMQLQEQKAHEENMKQIMRGKTKRIPSEPQQVIPGVSFPVRVNFYDQLQSETETPEDLQGKL